MTKRKLYLLIEAVLCVLLVSMLCTAAIDIFREGASRRADDPLATVYSREVIAAKLAPIAPLFYAWIGLTTIGLLLGARDHAGSQAVKNRSDTGRALKRASAPMIEERSAASSPGSRAARRKPTLVCNDHVAFNSQRYAAPLRAALILAAVALILLGLFNGGALDVFYKAANICTECIGLG